MQVIFHAVLLASVYLLVAGHNQPGGGFVGGAGRRRRASPSRYVAGGIDRRCATWRGSSRGPSSARVLLTATVTAAAPLLFGRPVLDSGKWELDVPCSATSGVSSVLAFDLGVYLVVIGLALMVFEAFGDDDHGDDQAARGGGGVAPVEPSERRRARR